MKLRLLSQFILLKCAVRVFVRQIEFPACSIHFPMQSEMCVFMRKNGMYFCVYLAAYYPI